MPSIDDLVKKKTKKFVKKDYRPWDDELLIVESRNQNIEPNVKTAKDLDNPDNATFNNQNASKLYRTNSAKTESLMKEDLHTLEDNAVGEKNILNVETRIDSQNEDQKNNLSYGETTSTLKDMASLDLEKYARRLYGLQRVVLQTLLNNISFCKDGYGFSKPLHYSNLALSIKAPINSIKGTLQKLRSEGIVEVYEYKPGLGGYTSYKIKEEIITFFLNFFQKTP